MLEVGFNLVIVFLFPTLEKQQQKTNLIFKLFWILNANEYLNFYFEHSVRMERSMLEDLFIAIIFLYL